MTSDHKGGAKKFIVAIIVLAITVLGVIAGVILNQQSQDIRSRAAGCEGIQNPTVTSDIYIPEGCSVSGTKFSGPAPSGANDNGDCVGYSQNGSPATYTGPYTITLSPSCGQCEQVDFEANGRSYGTAKYGGDCEPYKEPGKKVCGQSCSSNSDCISESSSGVAVTCRNGVCENASCPAGKTEPGTICQCLDKGVCGSPCGPKGTICTGETGIECGFLNQPNQCTEKGGTQYCLPKNPNNGYSVARCSGIAANYLIGPNDEIGSQLTVDDVIEACAPEATPSPSPTPVSQQITGQCLNIQAYDTEWNVLTVNDLVLLSPGDTVRFTVAGSTTGGNFDKARFTINGQARAEVTQKRPGTEQFYDEYTIPEGATGLAVSAQVHHSSLNWF